MPSLVRIKHSRAYVVRYVEILGVRIEYSTNRASWAAVKRMFRKQRGNA